MKEKIYILNNNEQIKIDDYINRKKNINNIDKIRKNNEKFKIKSNVFIKPLTINSHLFFVFYLIIFYSKLCSNNQIYNLRFLGFDSQITLTIDGYGTQPILNNKNIIFGANSENLKFEAKPSKILVNGEEQNYIDFYVYNLTLQTNEIKIKFNNSITNCNVMFYGLFNIINISFVNFDFSQVTSMRSMLENCENLISVDLSNANTSSVTNMVNIFTNCKNLISVNLNNFNTSSVTAIRSIFEGCSSLISLDLSSFNTSSVTNMANMFEGCKKLISLDLSNFETSSVTKMDGMFYECNNLISLDLRNFNTSSVSDMCYMFNNCKSLISLDLRNFDTSRVTNSIDIMEKINSKIIICFYNSQFQTDISTYLTGMNNNCSDLCFNNTKKIIFNEKKCTFNCPNNSSYEYNNICYEKCPDGTIPLNNSKCIKYPNPNSNQIDQTQNEANIPESNNFDIQITNNFSSIELTNNILTSNFASSNDIIYSTINPNNEAITSTIPSINNIINIITSGTTTVNNIPSILINDSVYIYNEINDYLLNNLTLETYFNNKNIEKEYSLTKDQIINNVKKLIISNTNRNLNSIIEENNNLLLKDNDIIYQLTTIDKLKNNEYNNMSTINLEKCENILKTVYDIDKNYSLPIFKVDYFMEGLLIPVIGYDIFHPINNSLLDLKYCSNETTDINIPVIINEEEVFKYNPKSDYYNDDCSPYTTDI